MHACKVLVHHKDRDPYNDKLENLVVLCPSCHRTLHIMEDSHNRSHAIEVLILKEMKG